MHRIAAAFISGAGLLLLLPLFLKDVLAAIVKVYVDELNLPAHDGVRALWEILWHGFPVAIAFLIPLSAMYLLLRELILFYFSASIPEPQGREGRPVFHPRFALTAIPFADDEGGGAKSTLRALQFKAPLRNFILPHDEREKAWLSQLVHDPEGSKVALPDSEWLAGAPNDDDRGRLRMAFGLAGAYDCTLTDEAAKTELSLIRHNLVLRRLVLRYMKALLLFIWTALVLFCLVSWLGADTQRSQLLSIGFFFLLWSSLAPFWVRAPVRWIYREFDQNSPDRTRDLHLVSFERFVTWLCLVSTLSGIGMTVARLGSPWGWLGLLGLAINAVALLRSHGLLDRFRWV